MKSRSYEVHRPHRRRHRASAMALALFCSVAAQRSAALANSYTQLPLPASSGNALLFQYYPELTTDAETALQGVPFLVGGGPGLRVFASTDSASSMTVPAAATAPLVVHLLLNARNSWETFRNQTIGKVQLSFDNGRTQDVGLVAGQNIREWRPLEGGTPTVNTVADRRAIEVHREARAGGIARLDKVTITVDPARRGSPLVGVSITDVVTGATNPGLLLVAVTVERAPESIVYISDGEVWMSDADGAPSSKRRITTGCLECDHPSLSPQAREAVFVARNATTGAREIRLQELGTGAEARVLQDLGPDAPTTRPLFTGDGAQVVFHKHNPGGLRPKTDVFSLAVDGGGQAVRRTKTSGTDETNPAPSPRTSEITYVSRGRIYRLDERGRRRVIFRRGHGIDSPDEPVFSPDGSRIVFRARQCGSDERCSTELFSIPKDGGVATPVTFTLGDAASPAFLPDGRTIVVSARGAAWSVESATGTVSALLANATAIGAAAGDGLPAGCLQPSRAAVCYQPYRTLSDTPLRMGASPSATAVVVGGNPVILPAGTQFGVQSEPLGSCPQGAVPSAPMREVDGFRWGYAPAAGPGPAAAVGWIDKSDLVADDSGELLCGATGTEFQCNKSPSACPAARCNQPLPDVFPDQYGDVCNVPAAQLLYASPEVEELFPGQPSSPAGAPVAWIAPADHFKRHWATSFGDWACVEVIRSHVGSSRFGWMRTDPSDQSAWCDGPTCGDGEKDSGEACDDFNGTPCDGCEPSCKLSGCGDGTFCPAGPNGQSFDDVPPFGPAECDDGNAVDTDQCTAICRRPFCGDGRVNGTEGCDDGNRNDTDGCRNDCTMCGDRVVQPAHGEACDDGLGGSCPDDCSNDRDGDGDPIGSDCDDNNPYINHRAADVCENGVDDDCSGGDAPCYHTCTAHCSSENLATLQFGILGWDVGGCINQAINYCRAQPWQDADRVYLDASFIYDGTRVCCAKCRSRSDAYNMGVPGNCASAASNWCNQAGRGGLDTNTPWYNPGAFWGACRNP